ncbi:hypothetical protein Tco_0843485 [Tanacetum coccineum]|uniref:Uncharacterized protein n=1 Tax=Tanacetum coccineum TaxID=301880 RepID=A0ABQ5B3F5_9ASTR
MDVPVMNMEEDLAALFGDDDFEDDASDGFDEEEVWEDLSTAFWVPRFWTMGKLCRGVNQVIVSQHGQGCRQMGSRLVLKAKTSGQPDWTQRDEMIAKLTQQLREHTDAVHFGIEETDCSIGDKTTMTSVVLLGIVDGLDGTERGYQGRCLGEVVS